MTAEPLITLWSLLLAMLASTAHALACVGAGRALQRAIEARHTNGSASPATDAWIGLATQFLSGVAVFNAVLIVLGLLGWLRPLPVAVVQCVGWLALITWRPAAGSFVAAARAPFDGIRRMNWPLRVLAFVVMLFFIFLGMAALAMPPAGDAEAFYLAYAKIMASSGVLEPMRGAYETFSSIGLPAELHFAVLMGWQGTPAAKFFVWPVALACGVFLAGIVGLCGGGVVARCVSWIILVSSSSFALYVYDGKVDLFAAAFGLAALYWLLQSPRDGASRSAWVWAGWMAGNATVAKFSYLITLGVAMVILLVWQHRSRHEAQPFDLREIWRATSLLSACAVIAWLPQLLKNGVLYGAPLAPFLGMGETGAWLNQVWHSPETTRQILLTYPWALVFGAYPMQGGGVSALLLVLPPLAWMVLRRPRVRAGLPNSMLAAVTAAALLSTVAWMAIRPSVLAPRYILATLLLFAPFAALVAEAALIDRRWWLRAVTLLLLVLGVRAAFNEVRPGPTAMLLWAVGQKDRCLKASESCAPLSALAIEGRPGERVMLAGYYGFWLRADQLQCRDSMAEQDHAREATDALAVLQAGGFRYAVIERSSHGWLEDKLREAAPPVRHLGENGNVVVYELPSGSERPRTDCVEIRPGHWKIRPLVPTND